MNRFLIFLLLAQQSCSPELGSFISMDNTQVIYRGFDNQFEYSFGCGDCKENALYVEGGSFRIIKSEEKSIYQGIFKADSISKIATISTFCICKTDTTLVKSKSYPIIEMPRPQIFLGGLNLTDYSIYDMKTNLDTTGLIAKYINHPSISHVRFMILELSVTVNGKEQILGYNITERLNDILTFLKAGESIVLNSINIWYPTNLKEKIYLKREITKLKDGNNLGFIIK